MGGLLPNCFPRRICREMDPKWGSQDTSCHPYGRKHQRLQLYSAVSAPQYSKSGFYDLYFSPKKLEVWNSLIFYENCISVIILKKLLVWFVHEIVIWIPLYLALFSEGNFKDNFEIVFRKKLTFLKIHIAKWLLS